MSGEAANDNSNNSEQEIRFFDPYCPKSSAFSIPEFESSTLLISHKDDDFPGREDLLAQFGVSLEHADVEVFQWIDDEPSLYVGVRYFRAVEPDESLLDCGYVSDEGTGSEASP